MAKITYIAHDGANRVLDVASGLSIMEGAVRNNVPGIDAECGGACSCATCHVFVDEAWCDRVGAPNETEAAMLEFAIGAGPTSRLSCQIPVSSAVDGLIVRIPKSQS